MTFRNCPLATMEVALTPCECAIRISSTLAGLPFDVDRSIGSPDHLQDYYVRDIEELRSMLKSAGFVPAGMLHDGYGSALWRKRDYMPAPELPR